MGRAGIPDYRGFLYISSLQSGSCAQRAAAEWTYEHMNERYRVDLLTESSGDQENWSHKAYENKSRQMCSAVAPTRHVFPPRNFTC
ncbi:hypothetical protein AMECASPLE_032500 [Ameca splendens]|uniref:Uncharacterized protein n=1 Tax=Ameca splendens TaxID=208324 RepID=A0ABV0YIS0_9TELE